MLKEFDFEITDEVLAELEVKSDPLLKRGQTVKLRSGKLAHVAKDQTDETVKIEADYQSAGGHIFPIHKWINMDEIALVETKASIN